MNKKILLIIIILIGAFFRLILLDQFPNGFTGDEAQQGYSAYSIAKTGKDEWGQVLPLNPRGFGDFKPPLYTYLTVPSVAILGLNIYSTRLPAAIAGILSILVVYYLVLELFKDENLSLWAAFFLSISPWGIQISRTAFEGGIGILTFSLGLLFFLKGKRLLAEKVTQKTGQIYWLLCAFSFGLTLYTYHSWRVFVAIFVITLAIYFRKSINYKKVIFPTIILVIFILPLILNLNSVLTRSTDVGIFSNQQINNYFLDKTDNGFSPILGRILDNKFFFLGNQFLDNYLSYFSPSFYFGGNRPDNTYLNFPYFPLAYPIEIIFWILGIYLLVTKKMENKIIIIFWFLLASIPASLAIGSGNANRAPTFLPLTAIFSALGANFLTQKSKWFGAASILLLIFSFSIFLYFYFVTLSNKPIENLRYGYKETFQSVLEKTNSYDKIVFSKAFTEPQIFVAFYSQMNPTIFQAASQDWLRYQKSDKLYVDQLESWNLGKYYFQDLNWNEREGNYPKTLVIAKPGDFPSDVDYLQEIKDPSGKVLYQLVPTNK